ATLILYIFTNGILRIAPKLILYSKPNGTIRLKESHLYNPSVTVTDYRHCAETRDHRVEGSKTASNATLYINCRSILLADHCSHFSYLLPHYVLLPPPSLCIYRSFRATFIIKSFIQFFTLQSLQQFILDKLSKMENRGRWTTWLRLQPQ